MRVSSGKVGFADTAEVRFLRAADQVPLGASDRKGDSGALLRQ